MERVTCAQCQHCDAATGACHRAPPLPSGWPIVQPTDWCGEATRLAAEIAGPGEAVS